MPISIEVTKLRVRSLNRDVHEVSWNVEDTTEDLLDYTFQVIRSESPSGPFDEISPAMSDRYLFIDGSIPVGDRWRMLHYLIRVVHVPSGDTKDFGPVTIEPEADLIALELRRHVQLLMHEFSGRKCWVLPVRTFGQRCDCWDNRMSKKLRSRCIRCFDTSFVRGYLHPIEVWLQIEPSTKAEQATNVGMQQQVNSTARVGYYPPLKPRDLIIEPENRRWKVVGVSGTEHVRAPVHQEIQIHEVPPKDIEFEVPLVLDQALKDIFFSPPRNYSNPQNLDAFEDEEIPSIFGLYQQRPAPR